MPPSNSASGMPCRRSRSARWRQAVAMVDEHQLLLGRVLRQQLEQCGLLRAGGAGAVARRAARPSRASSGWRSAKRATAAAAAAGDDPAAASRCCTASRCCAAARRLARECGQFVVAGLPRTHRASPACVEACRRGSRSAASARVLRTIAPRIRSRSRSRLAGSRGLPGAI